MTLYTEGRHTAEYIASEANGTRSRETATLVAGAGNNLPAGAVLAQITTGADAGKYTLLDPDSAADPADGTAIAAAVLFAAVDASAADRAAVITKRDTEVKSLCLEWPAGVTGPQKTTALGELASLGIVAR